MWLGGLHNDKHVCAPCRAVFKQPFVCEHGASTTVTSDWRPPRKNDDKAWKRIEAGDIWWDKRAWNRTAAKVCDSGRDSRTRSA